MHRYTGVWFLLLLVLSRVATAHYLTGDERFSAESIDQDAEIRFCVSQQGKALPAALPASAASWTLALLPVEGGFFLASAGRPFHSFPFQIALRPEEGGRYQPVYRSQIIAQGEKISRHCAESGSSFRIKVTPVVRYDSLPAGIYRQRLRLKLQTSHGDIEYFDVRMQWRVYERAGVTIKDDIHLPEFDGRNDVTGQTGICVFRNGAGFYAIRMQGEGPGGSFIVSQRKALPFLVEWLATGSPAEILRPSAVSREYRGSSYSDCQGQSNAEVRVSVPASRINLAESGRYSGRLRITIEAR